MPQHDSPTSNTPKKRLIRERRLRVLELRARGYLLREIAEKVGVPLPTVQKDLARALRENPPETGVEGVVLAVRSLDLYRRALESKCEAGNERAIGEARACLEQKNKLLRLVDPAVEVRSGGVDFAVAAAGLLQRIAGVDLPVLDAVGVEVVDAVVVDEPEAEVG